MNSIAFATSKKQVDDTSVGLFGLSYYSYFPNLVTHYQPHDLVQLRQALLDLAKLTAWKYQKDYFDSTEMAALTEYGLRMAGFETVMVIDADPTVAVGHAWVLVALSNRQGVQLVPVEPTSPGNPQIPDRDGKWAYMSQGTAGSQTYDDYLTRGWVFEDIFQAYKYLPSQFDWWNSSKIDRSWFLRFAVAPTPEPTPTPVPTPMVISTPTPMPRPALAPGKLPLSVVFLGWSSKGAPLTASARGQAATASITMSNGQAGQYELRIRKDAGDPNTDTVVAYLFLNYQEHASTWNLSFVPRYATGEEGANGYYVDLVEGSYGPAWTMANAYPPRLRVAP